MRATLFVVAAMMAASPSIGATVTNSYTVTVSTTGGGSLLPPDRDASANWKMAGLQSVGGIPSSKTQCGSTLTPSGGDDTAAINSAIAACSVSACPSGKYVSLGSGTFLINAAGTPVQLNKCLALRGQGPGTTILHSSDGAVLNSDLPGTS